MWVKGTTADFSSMTWLKLKILVLEKKNGKSNGKKKKVFHMKSKVFTVIEVGWQGRLGKQTIKIGKA